MIGFRRHVPSRVRPVAAFAVAVLLPLVPAACSGGGDGEGAGGRPTTSGRPTTTTAAPELTVLVTNDDGIGAPGIDALVQALRAVPRTRVEVVAPAANQSGTGGRTTPDGAAAAPATTASGVSGTAVDGFPADAVAWALAGNVDRPDVVLSGINAGANLGPVVKVSGTVGAAAAAASAGVPALAVSQGLGDAPADWSTSVRLALDWLERHRSRLAGRDPARGVPATLANLNVPTCTAGTVRGVLAVPVEADGTVGPGAVDCAVPPPPTNPTGDVSAFAAGWATLSDLAVPAPVTPTSIGGPAG